MEAAGAGSTAVADGEMAAAVASAATVVEAAGRKVLGPRARAHPYGGVGRCRMEMTTALHHLRA